MKRLILIFMIGSMVAGCAEKSSNNPLLSEFVGIHGTPDFTKITNEDYMPAFEQAIKMNYADVDAIVNNPEAPTFENTIEALEFSGGRLTDIAMIFFNLNEANTSEQMQNIALELSPKLTEMNNDISLNPKLFARVKAVYDRRDSLNLNVEQRRLLDQRYKGFARSGAALSDADKITYRKLTSDLAQLSLKFDQNTLAATNAFVMHLTDSAQVAGLPSFVVEGAADEAKERGLDGWVVSLKAPSMIPFMTYSSNRELKEKLWRANSSRAFGGDFDNTTIVKEIANKRLEVARLLGYNTYADYVLEEHMAGNVTTVNEFLDRLLGRAIEGAKGDVAEVGRYAKSQGANFELMPWDFAYFSEKLKDEKYSINEELTKPYFQLEKAQQGVFDLSTKLFGVTFKQNDSVAVYHPDVKAYEVFDRNGEFMAVLYMDFFPRESKNGGAWMTEFRGQSVKNGVEVRPLVSVVCNFTKPTSTTPSLLTFDEVTTLLHEFGHALHGILAKGTYPSLTGTSVYRDFVELPSQIMENWATEKEFLDMWATHYQTSERIPADMIQKIIDAKNYLAAYSHIRQVSFGLSDMAWHSLAAPFGGDVNSFERQSVAPTQILPYVDGQCMATSFGHIFSGGYASGYYSYKWAEVLDADAFSLFQQRGIFNAEVASSFRDNVLSKGGTDDPMTLYVNFRGHKPNPEALFDRMGLEEKNNPRNGSKL